MGKAGRIWRVIGVLALVAPLGLTACGAESKRKLTRWSEDGTATAPKESEPLALSVTPANDTAQAPVTTEIGTTVTGGTVTAVTLADATGRSVPGAMRDDGTAWVPTSTLEHARTYTATVTAAGGGGTETRTTRFTTMARPGGSRVGTGLYLFDGNTYGVAMPVVVEFDEEVPAAARASVERRLFVKSEPAQAGVWHWFGGRQVMYRPRVYWKPGTKLTVRSALGGHPIGRRFGDVDRGATATIGNHVQLDVDNATKQMNVYVDGALARTLPVSLGKPSTPSSSGRMVIMSKEEHAIFDTTRTATNPDDRYRLPIDFAQRLTWRGEFLHSAPWSVGSQGRRNVSHGCVNVSSDNAVWLFRITHIGDPVIVRGTERKLEPGNGWTAWDLPWKDYVAGSALPQPVEPTTGPANAL